MVITRDRLAELKERMGQPKSSPYRNRRIRGRISNAGKHKIIDY